MDGHDARKLSSAAEEDLRRRVVRAVLEQGLSKAQAARLFTVSRTQKSPRIVRNYFKHTDVAYASRLY